MEEIEVKFLNIDVAETEKKLAAIGAERIGEYFYKRRVWPAIPSYLEIEAASWADVDVSIKELGLNPEDKKIFSTMQIYRLHGIEELDYSRVTFDGLVKK